MKAWLVMVVALFLIQSPIILRVLRTSSDSRLRNAFVAISIKINVSRVAVKTISAYTKGNRNYV